MVNVRFVRSRGSASVEASRSFTNATKSSVAGPVGVAEADGDAVTDGVTGVTVGLPGVAVDEVTVTDAVAAIVGVAVGAGVLDDAVVVAVGPPGVPDVVGVGVPGVAVPVTVVSGVVVPGAVVAEGVPPGTVAVGAVVAAGVTLGVLAPGVTEATVADLVAVRSGVRGMVPTGVAVPPMIGERVAVGELSNSPSS